MMAALEGHKMARAGAPPPPWPPPRWASFVAGTIGTVALTFLAPAVADIAIDFGPPEYVALMASRSSR